MSDLTLKYRPSAWKDVIGQDDAIKSLRSVLKNRSKHAFLLTVSAGLGKTTVARLIAKTMGCESQNILEIDAATNTGIDAMRVVASNASYKAFGESLAKAVICDEWQ